MALSSLSVPPSLRVSYLPLTLCLCLPLCLSMSGLCPSPVPARPSLEACSLVVEQMAVRRWPEPVSLHRLHSTLWQLSATTWGSAKCPATNRSLSPLRSKAWPSPGSAYPWLTLHEAKFPPLLAQQPLWGQRPGLRRGAGAGACTQEAFPALPRGSTGKWGLHWMPAS